MLTFLAIAFFIFGIIIGSFSNVVIYRLPNNLSIVKPRSACPKCHKEIKWYDNIPILSYVLLKGKCRECHEKIPFRYPLVEGIMGIMYLLAFLWFGLQPLLAFYIIFITIGIIIIFIDLSEMIIPDSLNLSILILGFAHLVFVFINDGFEETISHLLGMVFGFGLLLLVRRLGFVFYKREALGFGDVKLMGASGLFLGLGLTLLSFLVASITGAIIETILMKTKVRKKHAEIPFGPYLILGMLISLFFGNMIISWYFGFFWEMN